MENLSTYSAAADYETTTAWPYWRDGSFDWENSELLLNLTPATLTKPLLDQASHEIEEREIERKKRVFTQEEEEGFDREQAFLDIRKSDSRFMQGYEGKFIAMRKGEILDVDESFSELADRISTHFPFSRDIFITKVVPEKRVAFFDTPFG